ncbi:hypothetical protein DV735_g212, partial [Chaetothyriales sp. CBS 134920]
MSGANMMPHSLTGGAGYKASPTADEFLRRHSGFYRRHSAASSALENDRRTSQAVDSIQADAQQAVENVRRGSIVNAAGGAAATITRKGSVAVASDVERRESIFGLEASAGTRLTEARRPSTSLASDLYHKLKGDDK